MLVNPAHLHLLLNHVPTVGSVVALGLLLLAFVRRDEALKHAGLEVLFAIAVLTLPVYTTGVAAYQEIRKRPELSDYVMKVHQDAALYAFVATELAGFVAWLALWQTKRRGRAAPGVVPATMVILVLALAITARAANLGGDIRHPEIHADAAAAQAAGGAAQFLAASISHVMVNSTWVWPLSETLHFLGLSLSFGVLLAVNLRILGAMKQIPFADVHRLLPWGMLGFGVNIITGMMFFIGQPGQYATSSPFFWKVVFLMVAGANFLYLTVAKHVWVDGGLESSSVDKAMAASSIAVWLAVLFAGRMLPFIGNAF
jgi:hypothetical protein